MPSLLRRVALALLALSLSVLTSTRASAFSTGVSNSWGFNSAIGCASCHSNGAGTPVPTQFAFTGNLTPAAGATVEYTLTVNVGTGAAAGINVSAFSTSGGAAAGTLSVCNAVTDPNCGALQTIGSPVQITHTARHFKDGSNHVTFAFNYTAPSSPAGGCFEDKIEIWVNNINNNLSNTGDQPARFDFFVSNSGSACPDDGNVCTVDACNAAGSCTHSAGNAGTVCRAKAGFCDVAETCTGTSTACPADGFVANGTSCDDGNSCTSGDVCTNGVCAGAGIQCLTPPACHTATGATCTLPSGTCVYPAVTDGTSCSDGNACTVADTCMAGVCTSGAPLQCNSPPPCHTSVGATCDTSTGACTYPLANDGTACNDNNACTQTDTCLAGACVGSNPVQCSSPSACHTTAGATCNPANGQCTYPASTDGTPCSDGDACTQTDTCQGGACQGQNPVVCDAPPACRKASGATCNPATGACNYPSEADGTPCDDGNACTQTDTCQSGACAGDNPVVCPAPIACHEQGVCDTVTGQCSDPLATDGTACSDQNACTTVDACEGGACNGTSPVTCPTPDQCHDPGTCDTTSGMCDNPAKPDGTACDDHDACTLDDTCESGACSAGTPVKCEPLDECHTVGVCNPTDGVCSNPKKPDGTKCSKGTCQDGACSEATGAGGGGPAAGSGGNAGNGGSGGGSGGADQQSGCGCRAAGAADASPEAATFALSLLAALLFSKRRRARAGSAG